MYYRPEQWDKPDSRLLAYLDEHELRGVFDLMIDTMHKAWNLIDDNDVDMSDANVDENAFYQLAWVCENHATGMYWALQEMIDDKTILSKLVDFCKYSLFY